MPVRAPSLFMAWNIATMGRTLPGLQYSTSRTSSIGTFPGRNELGLLDASYSPLTARRSGAVVASSEPGCSRDQKQPCAEGDGPGGSRDALTGRGKTFDGDGGRDDGHRENVHDPHHQEDGHQTDTALAAVEAEAQAMSPGRAGIGRHTVAPGLPAAGEVTILPGGELEGACQQDDRTDGDGGGARQREAEQIGDHPEDGPDGEVAHAHKCGQLAEAGLAVAP